MTKLKPITTPRRSAAAALAALALLAGCDLQNMAELREGTSTEADVRQRFGEPESVWETPEGRVFEYNRQPAGRVNYQIVIGTDGRMTKLRQLLEPANFARVQPGMPAHELRRLLGKPATVTPYPLKGETEWDWHWTQAPNTPMVFTAVVDRDLRVLRAASAHDRSTEAQMK
jgi:hypothetical protein